MDSCADSGAEMRMFFADGSRANKLERRDWDVGRPISFPIREPIADIAAYLRSDAVIVQSPRQEDYYYQHTYRIDLEDEDIHVYALSRATLPSLEQLADRIEHAVWCQRVGHQVPWIPFTSLPTCAECKKEQIAQSYISQHDGREICLDCFEGRKAKGLAKEKTPHPLDAWMQ